MSNAKLIDKWLTATPSDAPVGVVRNVLVDALGSDAICQNTGDSHQLRVKHSALAGMPGFGPYGHLSVPVKNGQTVKGYYLRRIAQAIRRLEEVAEEEDGKVGD